jgi:pimeloyl-ACP methyl ester carboxylesterase
MTTFQILRILLIIAVIICVAGCAFQRALIFPAERLAADHVFPFAMPGEETRIRTDDGVELNALVYRRFASKRIILFFHGNAGSLDSWGTIFRDYQYLKTDMIVFDYRGYGKSGGTISEKGLYLDGQAVYEYARGLGYAETDIIIYGRSVGTGIATDAAQGKRVAGLILESPFHSLRGLI